MPTVVAVTGASAGVGRATALAFAKAGCQVGAISRNVGRLASLKAEIEAMGGTCHTVSCDVADAEALDAAADEIEARLGPLDVWVNVAMATVFSPVADITPAEFKRSTEVTYLGQVYGTMAALKRMRPRNCGTIVNVGSALSYRAVPLQSAYCGGKYAVRGFTDALRSELIHDGCAVHVTMVHLPAVNTPQFDWALNKMGRRAQPVPPIFQPEVPARAILFAAFNKRREVWVGWPTVKAIVANKIAPGVLDYYLAKYGYSSQLAAAKIPPGQRANLFESVDGPYGAHGRFDDRARGSSWEMFTDRHRNAMAAATLVAISAGIFAALRFEPSRHRRRRVRWF
jgi:NAD(P)-dependent dehydrogenase (short-subunit alcohol dehydrogenase family)